MKIKELDPFDPILPTELDCPPADQELIDSIREHGVMAPILICDDKANQCYWLADGRRRVWAARYLKEHEGIVKTVPTSMIPGDQNDAYNYGLILQYQRSNNPISDYAAVRYFLFEKGMNYRDIAKATGMTTGEVKAIDKRFGAVPKWAVDAAVAGKIAVQGLEKIGKQSSTLQQELYNQFTLNGGKLTVREIDQARRITQIGSWNETGVGLFPESAPREVFYRKDLEPILAMKKISEVISYVKGLLG